MFNKKDLDKKELLEIREDLIDRYYRMIALFSDVDSVKLNEYTYKVHDEEIILAYITKDDDSYDYSNYEIMLGFDTIVTSTFIEFEQDGFGTLNLGTVKIILGYTLLCVKIKELLGPYVERLYEDSLQDIIGLEKLVFPKLEQIPINVLKKASDYKDLRYAKLGKLELKTKKECKLFFDYLLDYSNKCIHDINFNGRKWYIDIDDFILNPFKLDVDMLKPRKELIIYN